MTLILMNSPCQPPISEITPPTPSPPRHHRPTQRPRQHHQDDLTDEADSRRRKLL